MTHPPGQPAAPTAPTALESRFAGAQARLGPHRQQLIRAIVDHCEETCFLSSREVAKRYGVDAATVVRTVQALGYDGFAEFADDLRQHFMSRITPYTALKVATREKRSIADHVDDNLQRAVESVSRLRSDMDPNRVVEVAKLINRSRRILVVGLDFAVSLAHYLAYGLAALGFDAEAPLGSDGTLQHKVKVLTPDDLLIAISFGQCLRVTVESAQRARKLGVPTVGITDSDTTPIARYCDRHLTASVVTPSFLNSYVAPMALISAIHVACAHLDPQRRLTQLKPTNREYLSGPRWYRDRKDAE